MKREVNILTYLYLLFLVILFLSGVISGVFGEIVYFLAFLLPLGIGIYLTRDKLPDVGFRLDEEKIGLTLPLVMPTVAAIIVMSIITSLVIAFTTGKTNYVNLGDSFVLAVVSHAVLPAIFEELLFRYLPIRMFSDRSEKWCIILSAYFFALVHHDLFSIPYALVAGAIFMTVDLMTGSIIPSILIHFINNLISVILIFYGDNPSLLPTVYMVIGALTLISFVVIVKKREEYKLALEMTFCNDERGVITIDMLIFAGITLTLTVINLM